MELSPYIVDFYNYIHDRCLTDVHCPVCLVMSGKKCVPLENHTDLVTHNQNTHLKQNM